MIAERQREPAGDVEDEGIPSGVAPRGLILVYPHRVAEDRPGQYQVGCQFMNSATGVGRWWPTRRCWHTGTVVGTAVGLAYTNDAGWMHQGRAGRDRGRMPTAVEVE